MLGDWLRLDRNWSLRLRLPVYITLMQLGLRLCRRLRLGLRLGLLLRPILWLQLHLRLCCSGHTLTNRCPLPAAWRRVRAVTIQPIRFPLLQFFWVGA